MGESISEERKIMKGENEMKGNSNVSTIKKIILIVIFLVLIYGISAPFQNVSKPIFFGFLPAPIFYLLVFHILFVAFIGYMAFFTKLHGRIEDEEAFLSEIKVDKEGKR